MAVPPATPAPPVSHPPEPGNTRNRARGWCFTLNNPDDFDPSHLEHFFGEFSGQYVFQLEVGEQGTAHYQGFVQFQNQMAFSTLKLASSAAHWEVARDWKKSKLYASKKETRAGDIWTNMPEIRRSLVLAPKLNLFIWQRRLIEILYEKPDERAIYWLWDKVGGAGKTTFCRWFILKHPQIKTLFLTSGKNADIGYALAEACPTVVFFNITRTQAESFNYQALETAKDGIGFSAKYKSASFVFNIPHVVVFANVQPLKSAISADRWRIIEIFRE